MIFYLGTHKTGWLERTDVPLFVSRRQLAIRSRLPRARGRWALDSGGFSELSMFGRWETSPEVYASEASRFAAEVGGMDWAAIQDWMCEPSVRARTGLSVREHQERSIGSLHRLRELAPHVRWAPVLQGWEPRDYTRHVELYRAAGVELERAPVVGVGSVCRRQDVDPIIGLVRELAQEMPIHVFGFKTDGLPRVQDVVASSDSMAWSAGARRRDPIQGHTHATCANCIEWALRWRAQLLAGVERRAAHGRAQRALFA